MKWIGLPFDLGANMRGCAHGPQTIQGRLSRALHMIQMPEDMSMDQGARLDVYRSMALKIENVLMQSTAPFLFIGGDHSVSYATVKAVQASYPDVAMIWIDAHADYHNYASSVTHNWHGMPLALLTGKEPTVPAVIPPSRVMHVGGRSFDDGERDIYQSGITVIDAERVHREQVDVIAAVKRFCDGHRSIHVSFDLDSLDPAWAPGVSTPVPHGLTVDQLFSVLACASPKLVSMDIVEFNPARDVDGCTLHIVKQVATWTDRFL